MEYKTEKGVKDSGAPPLKDQDYFIKKVKLKEMVEYSKGYAFNSQWFGESGFRIVKVSDLTADSIDTTQNNFINENILSSLRLKCQLKVGDVIITTVGSWPNNPNSQVGKVVRVPKSADGAFLNQNAVILRTNNKNTLSQEYLYYRLRNRDFGSHLLSCAQGSANQASITLEDIFSFSFLLPKIEIQNEISDILFNFDKKIDLNQQMNEALESISQTLFKHWFIDFEFPNEEGKPYKSSGGEMVNSDLGEIPKGWDVEPLGSALSLLKDGTHLPPKRVDKGIKFIAGATDVKHFFVDFSKCTYITEDEYLKIHKTWAIRPDDILLTIVGTLGNVAIVRERDLPFSMQRSLALLRVNEKIPYSYLYFLLNSDFFKGELQKRINPTAQPGIYLTELSKIKIIVPSKKIVDLFHSVTPSVIKLMQSRIENLDILTDLRDSLLPKLISGKIRVPQEE